MKEYKKSIWSKFIKGIKDYNMIEDGDKIAIGVSGGKDSLLLVKLFQELKKDKSKNFEIVPITLNPGFKKDDLEKIKNNLEKLEIDYKIFDTDIWKIAFTKSPQNPCFLCAKMRRGVLYKKAEELGCNKLALGHHFDDIIETVLINMFYSGNIKTMIPKVKSETGKFELIRPMVYVKEKNIIAYMSKKNVELLNCGCDFENEKTNSKRKEVKRLLAKLEEENPNIKANIFASLKNVNLDYVLGYKSNKNK
ncbi:MAG: tRNA 2-thiocytidine(32) synthetase TtcA [Fusobacteriia bacterium 4572_132]|nr:MAG: tRNA 2-thiocytidine(32) synthetase TtcA [Fusobacteriia bacterium 4572_132]